MNPREIQEKVIDFLNNGSGNDIVYIKAFSCMECYECVLERCPKGLNPLLINEIIKYDYRRNNLVEISYTDPKDSMAKQRVLSSIQISAQDYKKIFSSTGKKIAKYVFFPGCNVYLQPEKILSALDIMSLITEDYVFLPGMDYCCGNVYIEAGDITKGYQAAQDLIEKIASYEPESVVLWCPTCYCRFITTIADTMKVSFKFVSFTQFLAENIEKLPFKGEMNKTLTLHEACKMVFVGKDYATPRKLLQGIPGINLVEMPRHGVNTVCCGSSAMDFFRNCMEVMRDERLQEAEQTNADILVDICQTCHNIFAAEEPKYHYKIMSYISVIAAALGIEREDKFKKYKQWGSLNRILEDAREFIGDSPYTREEIIRILRKSIAPND
jgi:Fe-S oxidoreductase